MVNLNNKRKGQSLPLNTIVIAILVIIVLLVIVIFFTTNVGRSGEQLEKNSASSCSSSNAALTALGYESAEPLLRSSCEQDPNKGVISVISVEGEGMVCCGTKKSK